MKEEPSVARALLRFRHGSSGKSPPGLALGRRDSERIVTRMKSKTCTTRTLLKEAAVMHREGYLKVRREDFNKFLRKFPNVNLC